MNNRLLSALSLFLIAVFGLNTVPARAAAPANDNFASATVLPAALPINTTGSNASATLETDEVTATYTTSGATVWWQWTPSVTQTVTITTSGSAFNTTLGVYQGAAVAALTSVAEDDDSNLSPQSRVTFAVTSGQIYYVVVGGVDDGSGGGPATGNITLRIDASAPVPANDNFANAAALTPGTLTPGTNVGASVESASSEPAHDGNGGGASVWYKFTAPGLPATKTVVNIQLSNVTFNNLMAVYTGSTLTNLTFVASSRFGAPVTFTADGGTTYMIAIDGFDEGREFGYQGISGPDLGTFAIKLQTGLPDLSIVSMTHTPNPAQPGTPVTFTVIIKNAGAIDIGPFSVSFFMNLASAPLPTTTADQLTTIVGMPAGTNKTITFTITAPVIGSYTAWALVDSFSNILESGKANNVGPLPGGHVWLVQPPVPVITSATVSTGTISTAYLFAVSATNSPTGFAATGLPGGLSIDPTTGIISGTPTVSGSFVVQLSATNAGGSGTATLSLSINPGPQNDRDGDGFPNELETALNSDPDNALSTPLAGASAGTPLALGIIKLDFKFNSTAKGSDSIFVSGFLDQASASLSQDFSIYIGGVTKSFKLTSGKSPKSGSDSLTVALKSGKLQFTGKFSKGTFSDTLKAFGVNNGGKSSLATIPIAVFFDQKLSTKNELIQFAVKSGKVTSKAIDTDALGTRR